LQFGFDPSTVGYESASYTVQTSAGSFNITLSGTGTNPVSLAHTSMTFGKVPEGVSVQPLTDGLWNFGQNVTVLGATSSSPLAADFPLLTLITPGEVLPVATPVFINSTGSSSLPLQFGFDPSTEGTETATYTIETSVGNFNLTLSGTGTSPISLSQSSIDFGNTPVGNRPVPLSVGLWNFGQNVQLLGISSSSPLASDFQLVSPVPVGQDLPVAMPVVIDPAGSPSLLLEFVFTASTTGPESVTYTITTSAGTLTLTLTGTGM
jgi:hypothetical protein